MSSMSERRPKKREFPDSKPPEGVMEQFGWERVDDKDDSPTVERHIYDFIQSLDKPIAKKGGKGTERQRVPRHKDPL